MKQVSITSIEEEAEVITITIAIIIILMGRVIILTIRDITISRNQLNNHLIYLTMSK